MTTMYGIHPFVKCKKRTKSFYDDVTLDYCLVERSVCYFVTQEILEETLSHMDVVSQKYYVLSSFRSGLVGI